MVTVKICKEKNGGYSSDVTIENSDVYEILAVLDAALDTLEGHNVSKLAVIDYVLNRENYIDRKESK